MSQNRPPPPPKRGGKIPLPSSPLSDFPERTPSNYDRSLESMVRSINERIMRAEILNGGFGEMKKQVTDIRDAQIKMEMEIQSIKVSEQNTKSQLTEINEAIYDPDNGIYRRINESIGLDKQRDEKLDKAISSVKKVEEMIEPIEKTEVDLKKIAGDDLAELQSIVKTRQVIDRMFWIMLTALIGGGIKILWDFVAAING